MNFTDEKDYIMRMIKEMGKSMFLLNLKKKTSMKYREKIS